MSWSRILVLCCILLAYPYLALATTEFDLNRSNTYLQKVSIALERDSFPHYALPGVISKLDNINKLATACMETAGAQLKELDALTREVNALGKEYTERTTDLAYIQTQKTLQANRLYHCRLTAFKAQDLSVQTRLQLDAKPKNVRIEVPWWQLVQGFFLTLGSVLVFISIVYLGNIVFDHTKLNSLATHKKQRFFEFALFKFALYALFACWTILMLSEWWGVPIAVLDYAKRILLEGGTIYGIKIIPLRLLLALMLFAAIQMAWKYTLLHLSKTRKIDLDAGSHSVLFSLLSYVVLALAILIGLAISGADFTGLAIVAGALSVGIGFGLQNIVNNFVAGIILLLEETIKPGDRVLIKGHEGFIKKINFRYTRMVSLLKEDVIIPNADLITTPIVNYVYDNELGLLKCAVSVPCDSNIDLVKSILLKIATGHTGLIQTPPNAPNVFINGFTEGNLLFELQVVARNVNKKTSITSDLYTQIAVEFKANNIVISYPQYEVRLQQK